MVEVFTPRTSEKATNQFFFSFFIALVLNIYQLRTNCSWVSCFKRKWLFQTSNQSDSNIWLWYFCSENAHRFMKKPCTLCLLETIGEYKFYLPSIQTVKNIALYFLFHLSSKGKSQINLRNPNRIFITLDIVGCSQQFEFQKK